MRKVSIQTEGYLSTCFIFQGPCIEATYFLKCSREEWWGQNPMICHFFSSLQLGLFCSAFAWKVAFSLMKWFLTKWISQLVSIVWPCFDKLMYIYTGHGNLRIHIHWYYSYRSVTYLVHLSFCLKQNSMTRQISSFIKCSTIPYHKSERKIYPQSYWP